MLVRGRTFLYLFSPLFMEIKGKKFICSCRTVLVLEYDEPRTGWFLRKTCVDSGFSHYMTIPPVSLSAALYLSVTEPPLLLSLLLKSHHHINRSSPVLSSPIASRSRHLLLLLCSAPRRRREISPAAEIDSTRRSRLPPLTVPAAAGFARLPVRRWFSTASPVRVPPCSVATGEGRRDSLPGRRSPHVRLRSRGARRLAAPPPPCRLCSCCS
jgi:hypothetical protein